MKKFDAIIIGFGKGGKMLALALANSGETVALIERSKQMYGGTCINVGCVASKALVFSAKTSAFLKGSFEEKSQRFARAIEEKNQIVEKLRSHNYERLANNPNITVIDVQASFVAPNRILAADEELEAEKIFINTGSTPSIPDIEGIYDNKYVYTSESLLKNLSTLPKKFAIIGGGYVGLEFASMFADFGSDVILIQNEDSFLPREDKEIASCILKNLENRGIKMIFSAHTKSVQNSDEGAILKVVTPSKEENIFANAVLISTGRHPNTKDLNAKAAGVEIGRHGEIKTDEYLRTSAPNIWALGDVAGGLQFTYISFDDYRIIKSQILDNGKRNTLNRGCIPYSMFLAPSFSRVGMCEQDALKAGYDIKIARITPQWHPKALILRKPEGLLKAVIDAKTDQILGAHFFCSDSHEMINLMKAAIDTKIPYDVLRDNIYTHPTMTEMVNELLSSV